MPAWRSDLRDAGVLARTELRAMARRLTDDRRRLVAVAFGLLQFAVVFPLFALGPLLDLGADLARGPPPIGLLGAAYVSALATGVYMGGASALSQSRIGSVGPLVRTSIPPRAVATGRIASELVQAGALFVPPLLTVVLLLTVGAGGPVPPLLVAVGGLLALLAGVFAGRAGGAAVRRVGLFTDLSAWAKAIGFVAVMSAIFVASQVLVQSFLPETGVGVGLRAFLPGRPLQAYAAFVLAPVGGAVEPVGLLAFLVVVAAVPLGLAAAVVVETALLLADAGDAAADAGAAATRPAPRPFARWPSTRAGWRQLLRTARDPKSLAHLFPLLFGGLAAGASWVTQPGLALTMGPPAAVVGGAVLSGSAYCLNPMGDDRDQLPLVLTSTASTAVLLRGRVVAGGVLGLALAVGVGTPLALVERPLAYAVGQTLLATVLVLASAGTALGLGALVPRFERREYVNVERAHPSQLALLGFLFGWALVAAGGLVLLWATLGGTLAVLQAAVVWAVYLLVLALLGGGGYRYARRTFDALTLDDV